jgi:hypothetical protein
MTHDRGRSQAADPQIGVGQSILEGRADIGVWAQSGHHGVSSIQIVSSGGRSLSAAKSCLFGRTGHLLELEAVELPVAQKRRDTCEDHARDQGIDRDEEHVLRDLRLR